MLIEGFVEVLCVSGAAPGCVCVSVWNISVLTGTHREQTEPTSLSLSLSQLGANLPHLGVHPTQKSTPKCVCVCVCVIVTLLYN